MRRVKYRRKNRGYSAVEALVDAQKIVFSPMIFQTIGTMLDLGILKILDEKKLSEKEIQKELNLTEYIVKTLLQTGLAVGIVEKHKLITGQNIKAGDKIIGLKSTGFRSNGLSLVRYILSEKFGPNWVKEKFDEILSIV